MRRRFVVFFLTPAVLDALGIGSGDANNVGIFTDRRDHKAVSDNVGGGGLSACVGVEWRALWTSSVVYMTGGSQ